jgi:hypothetical protein
MLIPSTLPVANAKEYLTITPSRQENAHVSTRKKWKRKRVSTCLILTPSFIAIGDRLRLPVFDA